MGLKEFTVTLNEEKRFELSIKLIKLGLPIWNEYAIKKKRLEYVDTVVGMHHKVDRKIITRVLETADNLKKKKSIQNELQKLKDDFNDPIVALQDLDWKIPKHIELIFYSAYNLTEKMNGKSKTSFGDEQLYLVINQICNGLSTSKKINFNQINEILKKFK